METSIFDELLLLPFFQGMSKEQLLSVAESFRLDFRTLNSKTPIVRQDELCQSLVFIIKGEVKIERHSDDHSYRLCEWDARPDVVQPSFLFGLSTHYSHSYTASDCVHLLEIKKDDIRTILSIYPTFRQNFLNFVSWKNQQADRALWKPMPTDLHERFVKFVQQRCLHPAGRKDLYIKMTQLGKELGATRLNTSRMLHDWAERQCLSFERGHIIIPAFEQLIAAPWEP